MFAGPVPETNQEVTMRVRDVSKEDETTLREIIRSVDKNVDHSLKDDANSDDPHFILQLASRSKKTVVTLSIEDLKAARTDMVKKQSVRLKIKKARDRMLDIHYPDVLGIKSARLLRQSPKLEEMRPFRGRPPRP